MAKQITTTEVDAFMRHFKLLIAAVIAVFFVPLLLYGFYLDRRLDAFGNSLRHSPPDELEGDDFVAADMDQMPINPVQGQIVYVPAYSHIYHGDREPYLLTITLSVRNTSIDREIVVKSVRYFDTKGNAVKSYLDKPVRLPALGTTEVLVARDDASGGSGANFLVEWYSNLPVTEPIIEAVMIDTQSQQGISFARRGSVISQLVPKQTTVDTPTAADSTEH